MPAPIPARSRPWRPVLAVGAIMALVTTATVASASETGLPTTPAATAVSADGAVDLVEVHTPTEAARAALEQLGLDVESLGSPTSTVVTHGAADRAALRTAGLDADVVVADLDGRNARARAAEERRAQRLPGAAASARARATADDALPATADADLLPPRALAGDAAMAAAASELPSGRVTYRTLAEVNHELAYLAATYPDRVSLFRQPYTSLLGTEIWGIEITHDVATRSGKPEMLMSGVHHAREWPTVDYTMELAWELLLSDGVDPRVTDLLDEVRVVFVPVVNPDGYDISRSLVQEFKRKNCRVEPGEEPTYEECADPSNFNEGVDLNRNYGSYWGSIGASWNRTRSNYRGTDPFSEPEIQNMRELVSAHQFTVAINNHTPDERILRAPADLNEPDPVDEAPYQALAEHLAEPPNYLPGPWDEIYYNGSGVAEQYAFYSTGAWAFTPELDLGEGGFHPPYEGLVEEWSQHREMYLRAMEAAADPTGHAVVTGTAPAGAELTIANEFTMYTAPPQLADGSQGPIRSFDTAHETSIVVGKDGTFTWHVNPSVRPAEFVSALVTDDWTISCAKKPGKKIRQQVDVTVDRGDQVAVTMDDCGKK